jgi:putative ABC transport system permease protein
MDLKFALRSLGKNPAFTALAVIVMALGIGANTAVFSVVNAVLLKPLAYSEPDRIVTIRNYWKDKALTATQVSAPDFHDWHDRSTAFEAMAYYNGSGAEGSTAVITGTTAEYASVTSVTSEFFDVFQVHALEGRMFSADELKPGSGGAALISDAYWHNHFAGNNNVLGRTVRVYDKPLTIVGVMPPGFQFPGKTDIWFPSDAIFVESNEHRSAHNYRAVGRLKPDVSVEQAQAQLTAIAAKLEQQYPPSNKNKGVTVVRMLDTMVSNVRLTLYMLLGAVGLVLLIACANMANLLLAKSTSRTREIAIRAAVGASRGRIIRQLITESLVLAVAAGAAGMILAVWGADALVHIAPSNVPRLAETQIDGWVLSFTLAVSVVSSILFGLAPAIQASRVDVNDSLKQGAAKTVGGGGAGHLRNALVVAEIALSVVLLTGAGLLVRSFQALVNVDLGYRPENILVIKTDVASSDDKGNARAVKFDSDVLADLRALPGASSVGASAATPGSVRSNGGYYVDALPPREQMGITKEQAVFSVIAPGTFETLGIALKRGRDFNDTDTHEAFFTAIVNEALVKESFAGRDPMGKLIFSGMDSPNPMKIVGVVGDVHQWGPATKASPEIFMPYPQHPGFATQMSLLIRTPGDPLALSDAVRRKIRERSPNVPTKISALTSSVDANVSAPRFRTLLLGIFAGLAVCLAMAGVYGVMAYVVSQRSNEIGLRMALGAGSGDVLKMVLRQALTLTAIGLAIGLAGAFAATRILTNLLFEVKPNDPLTYVAVSVVLAVVALVASFIPARRAARVDPLIALRQE